MIFPLIKIQGGIDRIYEVPLVFLENSQNAHTCAINLFPKWFRPVYTRCPGVKDRFQELFKVFKRIKKSKQRFLIDKYRSSRDIMSICSSKAVLYPELDQIDSTIQKPLFDLFNYLYEKTIGTEVFKTNSGMHINDHYEAFFKANEVHVCPFCGMESYTFPEFRRAEYDHYLPISKFPWLGVNLNNLIPMGDHCNGKKNDVNILYSDYDAKTRREVWYPYRWTSYAMNLTCIKKPSITENNGEWKVSLKAADGSDQEKIDTWNSVFKIELQYSQAIKTFHRRFIEDLAKKNNLYGHRLTSIALKSELQKYRDNKIGDPKIETMAKAKFIWANYYFNAKDSELAVITNAIAYLKPRQKP